MASLKDIKTRITSVRNTQKVASAMRMIASAKLHRTQNRSLYIGEYMQALQQTVGEMLAGGNAPKGSALSEMRPVRHVTLLAIGSSGGLCGAYSSNVWSRVEARLAELDAQGTAYSLVPIGKKMAHELDKRHMPYDSSCVLLGDAFTQDPSGGNLHQLYQLADRLKDTFVAGRTDSVEVIYTHFHSMGKMEVSSLPLLPFSADAKTQTANDGELFLMEPDSDMLYRTATDKLLRVTLMATLMDSATSEHASRMIAMQAADDNAQELLTQLTLLYNKTRQQGITNELIDLMSGRMSH